MPEISEAEFTEEVLAFLDANAEKKVKEEDKKFVWGEGSDNVALFDEKTREQELAELEAAKAWRAKRFDAGLGFITGPEEFGGRALPNSYERIYGGLESR